MKTTSIKVKFRPSSIEGKEGTIYYQIIHDRSVHVINTEYHVYSREWDETRSMVKVKPDSDRRTLILSIRDRIHWDLERLYKLNHSMETSGIDYSCADLIEEFKRCSREYTLFNYMQSRINALRCNGKERTSETYAAALSSFRQFRKDEDMMLESITSKVMESYQAWHKNRGNTPNTISFYMRILRAVYNRAVEEEIIENRNPFRHVYTGVERTKKRALPLHILRNIRTMDLSYSPNMDFARDMFLMSFYLRGMSFIDMAFLKKSNLRNGTLVYRRRKTGQQLTIAWTTEMQAILDKYPKNKTQYLLPIITREGTNERTIYRSTAYCVNRHLKKIGRQLSIGIPLTMYVARHSWASAARAKGIPVSIISEGMGHENESTTRIYLAYLDASAVDNANNLIIKSV